MNVQTRMKLETAVAKTQAAAESLAALPPATTRTRASHQEVPEDVKGAMSRALTRAAERVAKVKTALMNVPPLTA